MDLESEIVSVQPNTNLVVKISSINKNANLTFSGKLISINNLLQEFIDSDNFTKTTSTLSKYVDLNNKSEASVDLIYDDVVVLRDYGIRTYDFDIKKVKPLVELAQDKAEEETLIFFNTP